MWTGIQTKTRPAIRRGKTGCGKLPTGPGVTADHPNSTGSPPLNPPKRMFSELRRLSSKLYTPTLSRIPNAIQRREKKFRTAARISEIEINPSPNVRAAFGVIRPEGRGRWRVRIIKASISRS